MPSDICELKFTSRDEGDGQILPHLLDQIPDEQIGHVTGEAFDTRHCHTVIIPVSTNGRRWLEGCLAAKVRKKSSGPLNAWARPYGDAGPATIVEVGSR